MLNWHRVRSWLNDISDKLDFDICRETRLLLRHSKRVLQNGHNLLMPFARALTGFTTKVRKELTKTPLPKLYVEGSIPFARSNIPLHNSPYILSKR